MRPASRRLGLAAGLCFIVLASSWAPIAAAHNPGATLFHPVTVGDGNLVVGGEGTYAYLTEDGRVEARGNLSLEGEVLDVPVVRDGRAAVVVRSVPGLVPHVQTFDEEGPAWRAEVGEPGAFAYVSSDHEGFTAFTTKCRQVALTPDGEVRAEHELPAVPEARPSPADEGWWVPTADGLTRVQTGEVVDRRDYTGGPTDVTVEEGRVFVSLSQTERGRATLMVYDGQLELDWSRALEGLRFGGEPAFVDDRIVLGTYGADARLVALNASDGSIAWERPIANATAVTPTAVGDRIVAATTEGTVAFAANGTHLWTHTSKPYLGNPGTLGELVVASSSENRIHALHPDGTPAWSWSDGKDLPGWSHDENGAQVESVRGCEDDGQDQQGTPSVTTPALGVLLALVAVGLRRANRRG